MIVIAVVVGLALQLEQNPSSLTELSHGHTRVVQKPESGVRAGRAITFGRPGPNSPVIIHFHGDTWVPEQSVARNWKNATVLAVQIGNGSDVYQNAFQAPKSFQTLLAEAGAANGRRPVILSAYSAGYGAVRAILRHSYKRVNGVLLMDGLHTDYLGRGMNPAGLDVFLEFARDASLCRKRMVITHSEVVPGAYASTTETANWLLKQLKITRMRQRTGAPAGMRAISSAHRGHLAVLGFAGSDAQDHVDHLHGMATWLRTIRGM
ncbi:MAG TPA: hypothetical protein VFQ91_26160 [Bryobacteraceae bacterium]|nr:hypothetical protein [Bryobacteraceae bacterium]